MDKEYTISYKTYFNERLKPVLFHGKEMHPLYIQVIFDRKPIYFKSYFFDLLAKEKYGSNPVKPAAEDIIQKEERLLGFLSGQQKDGFSLEQFKTDYQYYCRDLLDLMDEGFKNYMITFFFDDGKPELSRLVIGSKDLITADGLMDALKDSLKPGLYNKLVEHTAYYAPPYLPLHEFSKKRIEDSFVTFSVFQWQEPGIEDEFAFYLNKVYRDYNITEVKRQISQVSD